MPHVTPPSFAQLVDWVEGHLGEEEASVVAAYVATAGAATQADIAWLHMFSRLRHEVMLVDPPASVRALLMRRFATQGQQQPSMLQRLVAGLTFDSNVAAATAGLRGSTTPAQQRQLIYSTDVADVALSIQPRHRDRFFDIDGQVFPIKQVTPDRLSIQLLQNTTERGITMTNDLGEFTFDAVPPGVYELIVSGDRVEVVIASVELHG